MFESEIRLEKISANPEIFGKRLDAILSTELTPKNIDDYADIAIDSLISLSRDVVDKYERNNPTTDINQMEVEDSAFKYYKLSDLGEILDHLSDINNQIHSLDTVIEGANYIESVIIPTDKAQPITNGPGVFEKPERESRVKSILFLLQQDFGINVHDKERLGISVGSLGHDMMRQESYYLINVPELQRTLLVCDEEGNVSYIFDQEKMSKADLDNQQLINSTKSELNDLIENNNGIGKRIVCRSRFIDNIRIDLEGELNADEEEREDKTDLSANQYLKKFEAAPEGYLSINGMHLVWGVGEQIIKRAIEAYGDELGKVETYRIRSHYTGAYSSEQQELIRLWVEKETAIAPEGHLSINGIARELGISHKLVQKNIEALGDELGKVEKYKFGTRDYDAYSPEQIAMIKLKLEQQLQVAPAGYLSVHGLAQELGVDDRLVQKNIEALGDELGKVEKYKFGTHDSDAYSPEQISMIKLKLEQQLQVAPAGYLNAYSLAQELGIGHKFVQKNIEALGDELGKVEKLRFGSHYADAYSPEQIAMIKLKLEQQLQVAPAGYLNAYSLGQELGVSYTIIKNNIEALGDELDKVEKYRFGTQYVDAYSPEQIAMIKLKVEQQLQVAPAGYLNTLGLAQELDVDFQTVKKTVEAIGDELGKVEKYRFGSRYADTYSPKQQELIIGRMSELAKRATVKNKLAQYALKKIMKDSSIDLID